MHTAAWLQLNFRSDWKWNWYPAGGDDHLPVLRDLRQGATGARRCQRNVLLSRDEFLEFNFFRLITVYVLSWGVRIS